MIRCIELFAGIGAQHMALEQLRQEYGLEYEIVAVSEIDPVAVQGYEAIHGPVNNLGDITKVEHLPECDLLFYSYPCTSISQAGKQEGMKKGTGTASSLLWEVQRLLLDMKERGCLPQSLGMENVPAVLNQKNIDDFRVWVQFLNDLGYTSSYVIMNAKDYGTPQNRDRIFMVSCLDGKELVFPEPCPDGRVLKDILEGEVPDEYYLSEERVAKYEEHKRRQEENGTGFGWKPRSTDAPFMWAVTTNPDRIGCGNYVIEDSKPNGLVKVGTMDPDAYEMSNRVYSPEGVSPTVTCGSPGIIKVGDLNTDSDFAGARVVYSEEGMAPTITTTHPGIGLPKVLEGGARIRYLTPRECLRLQAFPEDAIDRLMSSVTSKAQLYKLAGNSIAVCCLRAIFKAMYIDGTYRLRKDRQVSLERFL